MYLVRFVYCVYFRVLMPSANLS